MSVISKLKSWLPAILWVAKYAMKFFSGPPKEDLVEPEKPLIINETTDTYEILNKKVNDNEWIDWPLAALMANIAEIAYRDPLEAKQEFAELGFSSETIVHHSMLAYVLNIKDITIVTFRGTERDDIGDWIVNLSAFPAYTSSGGVHSGFLNAYNKLAAQVKNVVKKSGGDKLFFTGHSLGGALATLGAHFFDDSEQEIYGLLTFSPPRLCLADFKHSVNSKLKTKHLYFINENDPVPKIAAPYGQAGTYVWCYENNIYKGNMAYGIRGNAPTDKPMSDAEFKAFKENLKAGNDKLMAIAMPSLNDHKCTAYLDLCERMIK